MADTPSTTLDEVEVTAKAPQNNPTASVTAKQYQPSAAVGGDDLTLTVGNVNWDGWQRVQLTRSLDTVPANFDITLTEKYPNKADIDVKPGSACTVKLGGDLVLTGWIDRYQAIISPGEHTVHITGRSKTADLVDCAAFTGGKGPTEEQYLLEGSTTAIITQLAKAYDIEVNTQAGDGPSIPTMPINLGETAWEIIDRLTKMAQVLAYDMPDGSLMLATAGSEEMASGFTQGVNVEQASVNFTMDQRFSVYEGFQTSSLNLTSGSGGNMEPSKVVEDAGVPRFRKRIIIAEGPYMDQNLIDARVQWEANRRAGRSLAVIVTCDSWRDTANNLWAPNHMAPVDIPIVKIPKTSWCIGQVTYLKDEHGRHAIVMLMPKSAFLPEPMQPMGAYPLAADRGIGANNPTSQNPPDAPPADPPPLQPTGNYSVGGAAGAWSLGKP
jgi:prophage tail gpP-like protein